MKIYQGIDQKNLYVGEILDCSSDDSSSSLIDVSELNSSVGSDDSGGELTEDDI
jgi:hypothetical protein